MKDLDEFEDDLMEDEAETGVEDEDDDMNDISNVRNEQEKDGDDDDEEEEEEKDVPVNVPKPPSDLRALGKPKERKSKNVAESVEKVKEKEIVEPSNTLEEDPYVLSNYVIQCSGGSRQVPRRYIARDRGRVIVATSPESLKSLQTRVNWKSEWYENEIHYKDIIVLKGKVTADEEWDSNNFWFVRFALGHQQEDDFDTDPATLVRLPAKKCEELRKIVRDVVTSNKKTDKQCSLLELDTGDVANIAYPVKAQMDAFEWPIKKIKSEAAKPPPRRPPEKKMLALEDHFTDANCGNKGEEKNDSAEVSKELTKKLTKESNKGDGKGPKKRVAPGGKGKESVEMMPLAKRPMEKQAEEILPTVEDKTQTNASDTASVTTLPVDAAKDKTNSSQEHHCVKLEEVDEFSSSVHTKVVFGNNGTAFVMVPLVATANGEFKATITTTLRRNSFD